jgi:hypothetical protein
MALVWLAHGLLVALEWSYALDLVRGPLANGLAPLLRDAQSELTDPWLASLLALASVLAAYHGLIRRRVAQTFGEAAAMLAMIAAAMFVIADPGATVGALSQWSDEASLGSLDAIAYGGSAQPYAALASSMQQLYAATIDAPWCFLEFGNVSWCDSPQRLDPRLHAAAIRIAARIEAEAAGSAADRGIGAEVLAHRVQLLREAQSNGAIFLALPANGPLRNSVKEAGSLLYVLCGGAPDATRCQGPTAAEAEFRANSGTLPRIGGVVVIALGVLGMLLLIGFVALRLLEAAIVSVLFLMLAPAAALAPTLGDAGRAAFKRWAGRLLGAATAKLLWSVVLAALLTSMRLLLALQGLGWLTQWLLMGTLWWGVFLRRHGLLATVSYGHRPGGRLPRAGRLAEDAALVRSDRVARRAMDRLRPRKPKDEDLTPEVVAEQRSNGTRSKPSTTPKIDGLQPRDARTETVPMSPSEWERWFTGESDALNEPDLARETRLAGEPGFVREPGFAREGGFSGELGVVQEPRDDAATLQARLQRLRQAHADAVEAGDMRRAVSLAARETEVERRRGRATPETMPPARAMRAGSLASREAPPDAAMPLGTPRPGEDLDRARQPRRDASASGGPADGKHVVEGRRSASRAPASDARIDRNALDRDLRVRRQEPRPAHVRLREPQAQPTNPIMRDALEVAQRRKRQLGWGNEEED